MNFSVKVSDPTSLPTPCLVLAMFDDGSLPELSAAVDKATRNTLSKLHKAGDIKGAVGDVLLLQAIAGCKAQRILLVGAGKAKDLDAKKYNSMVKHTAKALQKYQLADSVLTLPALEVKDTSASRKAELLARSMVCNQYRYTTTKPKAGKLFQLDNITVLLSDSKDRNAVKHGLELGGAVGRGMNIARELGNLPGNICTPTYLGKQALQLARKHHKVVKAQVLSEAQMKRLGMFSLLSVGNGSAEPSALIIMQYRGAPASVQPNIIVGKGITFDTGGTSLKPGLGMDEMKFDMCGAASVMGTMAALCELKPAINVIGVIASAENMPGSTATKPGDVVTSMSGQTIEVLNTDAEGRLVLCDALTYIERFKPKTVVDIATLTGACITALGSVVSGLMSNDDKLAETLYQCGLNSLDPVWRLPLWEEYQEQLKSNFADIANIGGPKAGTITAGCFLARFTKKYKWAHLDIAGTAWLQGGEKGATGRPVPLLVEYLLNH
jgi:leucyl aminopeptidase